MFKSKRDKMNKDIKKENLDELEDIHENKEPDSSETKAEDENTGKEGKLQSQVSILRDRLLRKAAEFENYKKRTDNELSSFFKYANESLILELLPVLDDFDRLFNAFNEKHDIDTFKKGVELTYEKLTGILKKQGLKEMETNGKKFDFNLHDALLQVADNSHEPDTILETAEKGYFLKDKVLRHAKVVVSTSDENKEPGRDEKPEKENDK